MKVLSLFDGISCGMLAITQGGGRVQRYVAYEIDKYAIQVSKKNFSKIEHKGDVFEGDYTEYKDFDLLLGGSPCTYWSIAQSSGKREIEPIGYGWDLFMQYKRALKESGCKYFLYENNYSIHKDIKSAISRELGIEEIMINSALVCAQNRKRCYWTNIPIHEPLVDKQIYLSDILESGIAVKAIKQATELKINRDKALAVLSRDGKGFGNQQTNGVLETVAIKPIRIGYYGKGSQGQRIYSIQGKTVTLSANGGGKGGKTGLYKIDLADGNYVIRKLSPIECERCQTLPDNYTYGISNTQRYKCIGNCWTVDVIAYLLKSIIKT